MIEDTIIQRCCSDNCKIESDFKPYSCSKDRCNGIHSDPKLLGKEINLLFSVIIVIISAMKNNLSPKRIIQKRTAENSTSSLSCYDCSAHNPNCGIDQAAVTQGCRACLVFQNIYDSSEYLCRTNKFNNLCLFSPKYSDIVNRRCCTSGCGAPGTVGDYEGRTAYFCGSDLCNGIGAENELTTEGGK